MQKTLIVVIATMSALAVVRAQEQKPVPKDSVRVMVPGCSKNYVFTAGRAAEDQPGGTAVPEGTHLRMNAPKNVMAEIKGQEGSRIEISGTYLDPCRTGVFGFLQDVRLHSACPAMARKCLMSA